MPIDTQVLIVSVVVIIIIAVVLYFIFRKKSCAKLTKSCNSNEDCCSGLNCINKECTYPQTVSQPKSNFVLSSQNACLELTAYNNNLTLNKSCTGQFWNWDGSVLSLIVPNGPTFYLDSGVNNQFIVMTITKPQNPAVLLSNGVIATNDFSLFLGINPNTIIQWTDGTSLAPIQFQN